MGLIVKLVCMIDVFWINLAECCQRFPIEVEKSSLSVFLNELLQLAEHLFVTIVIKKVQNLIIRVDFLKHFFIIKVSYI